MSDPIVDIYNNIAPKLDKGVCQSIINNIHQRREERKKLMSMMNERDQGAVQGLEDMIRVDEDRALDEMELMLETV